MAPTTAAAHLVDKDRDNLIKIARPEKGDDFFELWRDVNDLIDAINDLTFTIKPSDYGHARIEEGDVQFELYPAKIMAALKSLQDDSNPPPDGKPDNHNPGSNPGPDPGSDSGGNPTSVYNPGCRDRDFLIYGGRCASIFIIQRHYMSRRFEPSFNCDISIDQLFVYDDRVHLNFVASTTANFLNQGDIIGCGGILVGCTYENSYADNCSPPVVLAPPGINYVAYQEDYDLATGYRKPHSPPP